MREREESMENNNKPVVHLISKPENMLKTIYTACRTCYSADAPFEIYNSTDDEEKMLKLIERVVSSGHYSTIEHIQVTFAISNVSRACTHQLVRHRHMSFSQKSQRYVKEKGQFDYLIPPTIARLPSVGLPIPFGYRLKSYVAVRTPTVFLQLV